MNKKTLTVGFLSAVVAGSVLLTSSVSAFWPFDGLFKKGEVKAVSTSNISSQRTRVTTLASTIKAMKVACDQLYGATGKGGTLPGTQKSWEMIEAKSGEAKTTRTTAKSIAEGEKPGNWKEDSSSIKEIASIDASLKLRCAEITRLYNRVTKIYKMEDTTKVTPTPTPTRRPGIIENIKKIKVQNRSTVESQ